jgi:hypothetical protein
LLLLLLLLRCLASAVVVLQCQVHRGNRVEAAAATKKLEWKQMITLSVEVLKMPLMYYFSFAAFLWGKSG